MSNLKIIVFDNFKEVGKKVDKYLQKLNKTDKSFIVPINAVRFSNGEGKVEIKGTVRNKDVYILSDVGNYNISYTMFKKEHNMSPDEHYQDIKRAISAISGTADKITLVTPLLYQSRQHKRRLQESLDCSMSLQELKSLGVSHIVSFDVHDPSVSNAVHNMAFDNLFATSEILNELITNNNINDVLVVSPDEGAIDRAKYYSTLLQINFGGMFYKRRGTKVKNGKNPITEHIYLGEDVKDKNIIVVDDMIASGTSMIEVAEELKKRGARDIIFATTFSLLTEGPDVFQDAYEKGLFKELYSTNLTYLPNEIKKMPWYHEVDLSEKIANIINTLNKKASLKKVIQTTEDELTKKLVLKRKNDR